MHHITQTQNFREIHFENKVFIEEVLLVIQVLPMFLHGSFHVDAYNAQRIGLNTWKKKITDEVLINVRKIIQMIDLHSRYLLKEVGLTGPQLTILNELSRQGDMSTGELAKAISLSQATVTGILERLEKKQLIKRTRSVKDRRKIFISITQNCNELLKQAPPPLQESFVSSFHGLENWEQLMILSSLQRLVVLMDAKKIDAAPMLATGPIDATQT